MKRFADMTVSQLLAALGSPSPTPGGGTAAAIAGAMGTSLLVMVAGLAKSKNNTDDEKAALSKARAAIEPITAQLTDLADADAASFDAVMAAYRLPKATDEEKAARARAIQAALRGATEVPLRTLRACANALQQARVVADYGNPSAESDVGVAIGLLKAAATGAAANVRSNLGGLKDETFKSATEAETARLLEPAAL
ncbi:MAG TPA: cyclodeaminase/cyclohydrolase family protein [Vicinamibacterales bacterium]|nr:cyclodeaminase/cyclohydrolase family protein [Vicinamibacterales bacterium]